MNKKQIYHLIIASIFFLAFLSPVIFQEQWVNYVKESQQHGENLLIYTIVLLMAIALTVVVLQIIQALPDKFFTKKQKVGDVA